MGGEIESGWVERQNQENALDKKKAKMDENRRKKNLNNIFKHLNHLDI